MELCLVHNSIIHDDSVPNAPITCSNCAKSFSFGQFDSDAISRWELSIAIFLSKLEFQVGNAALLLCHLCTESDLFQSDEMKTWMHRGYQKEIEGIDEIFFPSWSIMLNFNVLVLAVWEQYSEQMSPTFGANYWIFEEKRASCHCI